MSLKTLSLLSTLSLLALLQTGCSRSDSSRLEVAPGVAGTIIAVGEETSGSIQQGSTVFDFNRSAGSRLSIGVAASGPYPVFKNEAKLFLPASITKLVTTSLALKKLGPDFTFKTQVSYGRDADSSTARDLTIVADGDPQVVAAIAGDGRGQQTVFSKIVAQLKNQGITRLEGSLILISSDERHDNSIPAKGLEASDYTTCFATASQSFNLGWNCGHLQISHGQSTWLEQGLAFPVAADFSAGRGSHAQVQTIVDRIGRVIQFALSASGHSKETLPLPVPDVKSWYGSAFKLFASQNGIDASVVTIKMPLGASAKSLLASRNSDGSFVVSSEPLSDIVRYTNKPSDNFFADSIFKAVAMHHGSTNDLRTEGQTAYREAVSAWLTEAGRPDLKSEIHLIDGAGLSRENYVSPRAYMTLLGELTKEPTFPALWNSLPIAGQDGTLKERMLGTAAVGVVRAKTGTLKGSYQLAGYIPKMNADGSAIVSYIPFVILSTVDPSERENIFELQGQLASKLLKLVNPQLSFR